MPKKGAKGKEVIEKAVQAVVNIEKKKKKKKKKSLGSKLLSFASSAAPIALPLAMSLLANGHAGSRNLTTLRSAIPTGMAVGLNSGIPGNVTSPGIISQTERRDQYGKVSSSVVRGREEVGSLTIPLNAAVGDVIYTVELSPLTGKLLGSRLSLLAAGFARFRVLNVQMSVVSSLAATVGGQCAMAILTDPQQQIPATGGGPAVVRLISDSTGSDVFQVWSNGVCTYPGSVNVDPYYTNPLSPDAYLTSAGQGVIVAMTDGSGTDVNVGSVFLDYEIELLQPTLESFASISKFAQIVGGDGANSCTDASPLGLAVPPTAVTDNIGIENLTGAGFTLPPGNWVIMWYISGASIVSAATAWYSALVAAIVTPGYGTIGTFDTIDNGRTFQTAPAYFSLSLNTAISIPFDAAYTGITSETISANEVLVFTDPTSFPAAAFSSKKRLARLNSDCSNHCQSLLAITREKELASRLTRLEQAVREPMVSYPISTPTQAPPSGKR